MTNEEIKEYVGMEPRDYEETRDLIEAGWESCETAGQLNPPESEDDGKTYYDAENARMETI